MYFSRHYINTNVKLESLQGILRTKLFKNEAFGIEKCFQITVYLHYFQNVL